MRCCCKNGRNLFFCLVVCHLKKMSNRLGECVRNNIRKKEGQGKFNTTVDMSSDLVWFYIT